MRGSYALQSTRLRLLRIRFYASIEIYMLPSFEDVCSCPQTSHRLYVWTTSTLTATLSPPGTLEIGPELLLTPFGKPLWFVAALANKLVPWCAWLLSRAVELEVLRLRLQFMSLYSTSSQQAMIVYGHEMFIRRYDVHRLHPLLTYTLTILILCKYYHCRPWAGYSRFALWVYVDLISVQM